MEYREYSSNESRGRSDLSSRAGQGLSIGHHGEIFQGVYVTASGRLKRGLVSLLSGVFRSEAVFYSNSSGLVRIKPEWKVKSARAAELTLDYCQTKQTGGLLVIKNNIPPSWGLGSSTSDVAAAIRAVGAACGRNLSPSEVAELAVKAEIASDSVMFGQRAVLFAQRDGVVLEEFSQPLPPLEVLGFNTDPVGYDTLGAPPARYSWWEIEAFRPLIGLLRKAVNTQDAKLVGCVASASARINQRHLPKPHFDSLEKLTTRVGAVGLQVAHSGTIVGLLFDPANAHVDEQITEARGSLAELGISSAWRLSTRAEIESEQEPPVARSANRVTRRPCNLISKTQAAHVSISDRES